MAAGWWPQRGKRRSQGGHPSNDQASDPSLKKAAAHESAQSSLHAGTEGKLSPLEALMATAAATELGSQELSGQELSGQKTRRQKSRGKESRGKESRGQESRGRESSSSPAALLGRLRWAAPLPGGAGSRRHRADSRKAPQRGRWSPPSQGSARGGFSRADLANEAILGIGARPSRLFITLGGTVLGIGSLVVTIGLAQTTAGQIAQQFDAVAATQVQIEPAQAKQGEKERPVASIPWDAVDRVRQLAGVEEASLTAQVPEKGLTVTAVEVYDPQEARTTAPSVIAASPGLLSVARGTISTGRFFDSGHDERADRVVVLGARAAEKLGVNRLHQAPAIFINDRAYTVIGVLGSVQTQDSLLDAVVIPVGTARKSLSVGVPGSLEIRIAVGAGPLVAKQAPIALNPNSPEGFKVKAPQGENELHKSVQSDINVVFLALGAIALLAGGLGIANVTLLSVMERSGEIGLRRALGATRRQIGQQFMLESVATGFLGGLIGAAVGVFTLAGIAVLQGWTPVLALWVPALGALLGAVVGLGAGTYPALKAASIEPVNALRDA